VLLVGTVEVTALAQGALRQFTQRLWIEHPTFELGGGHFTTKLLQVDKYMLQVVKLSKVKLINTCFRFHSIHIFIQGFRFCVSELRRLDKIFIFLMLFLSLLKHFHQKMRQHAIVPSGVTLHRFIYRTISS